MSNFFPNARRQQAAPQRPGCIFSRHQIGGSVTLSLSPFIEAYALEWAPSMHSYKSGTQL